MKGKHFVCCILIFIFSDCRLKTGNRTLPFTFDQAVLQEELPELIIACGTVATANALLFKSSNSDSCVVGIIQCINLYGKNFFEKGSRYSMQVTQSNISDSLKNWVVENSYENKNYPVYLVTHITKIR